MDFTHDSDDSAIGTATDPGPKRITNGSHQQEAFWSELRDGTSNLLLEARAGTGKSSSCREGMWRLLADQPNLAIRYCCFNKSIAEEFRADCPPRVDVGTMHRFGLKALSNSFGPRVEGDKTYTLLDRAGGDRMSRSLRRTVAQLVSLAKNQAMRPDYPFLEADLSDLLWRHDLTTWGQEARIVRLAADVLGRSVEETSIVDFDDMLYLPWFHELDFPGCDLLCVDECQDLNPLQHDLVEIMSRGGRAVVVGDPYQAIYGWRGAASDSIPSLRDMLNAKTLYLTVSWRCPKSHVRMARHLVSDFDHAPGAEEGTLSHARAEALGALEPGDLVLCRSNAPLVKLTLSLIGQRIPAAMRGREVGGHLTEILAKTKAQDSPTCAHYLRELHLWKDSQQEKLATRDGTEDLQEQLQDRCSALEAITMSCSTPTEIPAVIRSLFDDSGRQDQIQLSSVHRAKGSEADSVYFLDVPYPTENPRKPTPLWQQQERRNVHYVALTRSTDALTIVA